MEVGVDKLRLKEPRAYVKYALFRVKLFATKANGIDEMRFSTSRWAIDEHRIELWLCRMFSDRES